MKDATHHLRGVQRKVLRSIRKEAQDGQSQQGMVPQPLALENPQKEVRPSPDLRPRKREMPKKIKTLVYH